MDSDTNVRLQEELDDQADLLEEEIAECSLASSEHKQVLASKRSLCLTLFELEKKKTAQERAHQREVKVYQEKIRELGIHNRRELEVARKRSEQEKIRFQVNNKASMDELRDFIRHIHQRRNALKHNSKIRLAKLRDTHRRDLSQLREVFKKTSLLLAESLRLRLEKEMKRQHWLDQMNVQAVAKLTLKLSKDISSKQERILAKTNRDRQDILEPRKLACCALKDEYIHSLHLERKYSRKVSQERDIHEDLRLQLRTLEVMRDNLKKRLEEALVVRKELRKTKAAELILQDRERVLKWNMKAVTAGLHRYKAREMDLKAALEKLLIELRERRQQTSNKLLEQLASFQIHESENIPPRSNAVASED
ncbi:hypothetical protein AAMO2058_000570100 [Amorphochlora amoebiformis]